MYEKLGFLILGKCEEKLWDPVRAFRNGPAFSHLFFVDDLVLFAKAYRKNCYNIKETLNTFCELSGQKISLAKSKVYFSPNSAWRIERRCAGCWVSFQPQIWVSTWVSHLDSQSQRLGTLILLLREFRISFKARKLACYLWLDESPCLNQPFLQYLPM